MMKLYFLQQPATVYRGMTMQDILINMGIGFFVLFVVVFVVAFGRLSLSCAVFLGIIVGFLGMIPLGWLVAMIRLHKHSQHESFELGRWEGE